MQVKAVERRYIDVDIDPLEALDAIKKVLFEKLPQVLRCDYFQWKGKELVGIEDHGHHRGGEIEVRFHNLPAEQVEILEALLCVKMALKKIKK